MQYPRVPGHEVVGVIDAVGAGVHAMEPGQRVGVGLAWRTLRLLRCLPQRRFLRLARWRLAVTGMSFDGGYADYMVAPRHRTGAGAGGIIRLWKPRR